VLGRDASGGGYQGYPDGGVYQRRDDNRGDDRRGGYQGNREGGGYQRRDDNRGGGYERPFDAERDARRERREMEPAIPEGVEAGMLARTARAGLRSLSKEHANRVAEHLVAAEMMIDSDPELAYAHAMAAQRSAGRIDVVREAVAIAAYQTGRYADALREARTVRRLSGSEHLRPIEADSERGLGRPDKALTVISEVNQAAISMPLRAELAIIASGARADLGEHDAGLLVVDEILDQIRDRELRTRLLAVKADRLNELGRTVEAEALRAAIAEIEEEDEAAAESVLFIEETIDPDLDDTDADDVLADADDDEADEADADDADLFTDEADDADDEFAAAAQADAEADDDEEFADEEAEEDAPGGSAR
ncbi:MAG: primosomal protein, partial [Ruaniaceae bacterium]|nr:primosomal protein [Ruaniaceae bacterium]